MKLITLTTVLLAVMLFTGCSKEEPFDPTKLELVGSRWKVYDYTYDASPMPSVKHYYIDMYEFLYFKSEDSVYVYTADIYGDRSELLENVYNKYGYSYSKGALTINQYSKTYNGTRSNNELMIFDKTYIKHTGN